MRLGLSWPRGHSSREVLEIPFYFAAYQVYHTNAYVLAAAVAAPLASVE